MITTFPATLGPFDSGATLIMGGIVPDDAPSSLPMAAMRRLAVSDMMKAIYGHRSSNAEINLSMFTGMLCSPASPLNTNQAKMRIPGKL